MDMLSIRSVRDLRVGDVGFYTIAGRVGGFVSFGQWLIDAANLARGRDTEGSWFTHAYIVVEVDNTEPEREPTATILEAMPGGARYVYIKNDMRCGPGYGYARVPLSDEQKAMLQVLAHKLKGTPYSFLDYLSLALLHLGLPRRFTAKRVADSGHMICSQLVDYMLCRVGVKLFTDGRVSQDVTPGALFRRTGAIGEVMWW